MTKDAGNDLQVWIAYLIERRDKLHFLKKPIEDAELIVIFLKGTKLVRPRGSTLGCLAFKHVPAAVRKKLDEHAVPTVYLGRSQMSSVFVGFTLSP